MSLFCIMSALPTFQNKGDNMIQLSYTSDHFVPCALRYDPDINDTPEEYNWHFRGYEYLTDEEALAMLEDDYMDKDTKTAIRQALD